MTPEQLEKRKAYQRDYAKHKRELGLAKIDPDKQKEYSRKSYLKNKDSKRSKFVVLQFLELLQII